MNLKELRDIVGAVVIFRPRPKVNGDLLKEAYNSWTIVNEIEPKQFLFQNIITNHTVILGIDHINDFRSPSYLIIRGQLCLHEKGRVEFEPFAPGLHEDSPVAQLVDETGHGKGNPVYEALKSKQGETVTLRFPEKGEWVFGPDEAIIEKITPNFITLRRPEVNITLKMPSGQEKMTSHVPEKTASIPLRFISVAEDVSENRLMIVFDHSFWQPEL